MWLLPLHPAQVARVSVPFTAASCLTCRDLEDASGHSVLQVQEVVAFHTGKTLAYCQVEHEAIVYLGQTSNESQ